MTGRTFPGLRTFGTAASGARRRFRPLWSRESLLRLILSVALATALWVYVTGKQDPTIGFSFGQPIPVSAANVPNGVTLITNLGTVTVEVRVSNRNRVLTASNFRAFVNLQNLAAGMHVVPVEVVADPGIQVLRVSPARVTVVLDSLVSKHVPVRWHILTQPPQGYTISNVIVSPSTVGVSGPRSILAELSQGGVYIDLSQTRSSISGVYKVSPETGQGSEISGAGHVTVDPPQVQVRVNVASLYGYKALPVLVSLKGQPANGYGVTSVTSKPSDVTLSGSPQALSQLVAVSTRPISLRGRRQGTFQIKVPLQLPHGVSVHSPYVSVTVKVAPVTTSTSFDVAITPINLPPGLAVHTQPASVLVSLVGPLSALQGAGRRMQARINLSGYGVGTFTISPTVTAPPGTTIGGVYPSAVTITLTASRG